MKDQIKRWNQLAGIDKKQSIENKPQGILEQNLYGNQFMNQLLNEDLGEELAKATEEKEEGGDESKEDASELGSEEKATLSNSELVKGLKINASNPLSFKLVSGSTSRSPTSLLPTTMLHSSGICTLCLPICSTTAGELKLSK